MFQGVLKGIWTLRKPSVKWKVQKVWVKVEALLVTYLWLYIVPSQHLPFLIDRFPAIAICWFWTPKISLSVLRSPWWQRVSWLFDCTWTVGFPRCCEKHQWGSESRDSRNFKTGGGGKVGEMFESRNYAPYEKDKFLKSGFTFEAIRVRGNIWKFSQQRDRRPKLSENQEK